jgi:hypothetical protein
LKFLFIFFLFIYQTSNAQSVSIQINYGTQPLKLGEKYYLDKIKDSLEINTLKFYISKLSFYYNHKLILEDDKPILYNLENQKSSKLYIDNNILYDSISFDLGIDSLYNTTGVMGGDLDPVNGMYWTWQTGYINFKLEGKSKVCKSRKNIYQYHLGGYTFPFNALQKIGFKKTNKNSFIIVLDIEKLLNSIDISNLTEIMSPRKEAVEMSKLISNCFSVE